MTQEDKELLLKDLCARLPHHCQVFYEYVDDLDNKIYGYSLTLNTWCIDEFDANKAVVKPYLRPMSSMTEEEKVQLSQYACIGEDLNGEFIDEVQRKDCAAYIDWLNKHHFDYRGLIEKGLAIEAPKEMYDLKIK